MSVSVNEIIYDVFSKLAVKMCSPKNNWTIEDETKWQEIMKFTAGSKDAQSESDLIKRIT